MTVTPIRPVLPHERAERERAERAAEIAITIKKQIGVGSLASLGAHNFLAAGPVVSGERGGLDFAVRILPFRADGTRGTAPRIMRCRVTLTAADDYKVRVAYLNRHNIVVHYEGDGFYFDQLPALMLALDYDGPTPLNPRIHVS